MAGSIGRSLLVALSSLVVLVCAACGNGTLASHSQSPAALAAPSLGTAQNFSVLAGETVTNTGPSTLNRDLGVSPGSAITGFPPGLVLAPGTKHVADATARDAQSDLTATYVNLAGQSCTADLTDKDLGGQTLVSGVYCFSSAAQLTGALVLDAKNDPAAAFVFLIGTTLTTASSARVELINGALPCNVYWKVGSSAAVGTTTAFVGNILALTSISLKTGASLAGRALARNGAVTLDSNQIISSCAPVASGDGGTPGGDGGTPGGDGGTPGSDGGTPGSDGGTPGGDGGVASLSCCVPAKLCGSTCANLQTDANNCGSCGKRCSASEVCSAGACAPCRASQAQCKDQCADLSSDPFNCGACGHACAASQSCLAGSCGRCEGTLCSNICVELSTDNANCGACGNVCAADQCCTAGSCTRGARNASMRDARQTSCKQQ